MRWYTTSFTTMSKLAILLIAPLTVFSSSSTEASTKVKSPTVAKRGRADSDSASIPEAPVELNGEAAHVKESLSPLSPSTASLPKRSAVIDLVDLANRLASSSIDGKKQKMQNSSAVELEDDEESKPGLVF